MKATKGGNHAMNGHHVQSARYAHNHGMYAPSGVQGQGKMQGEWAGGEGHDGMGEGGGYAAYRQSATSEYQQDGSTSAEQVVMSQHEGEEEQQQVCEFCNREWLCVRACMHACMRACVRACVRACLHVCVRACVRACVSACVCVQAWVCVCSCTREGEKVCACVRARTCLRVRAFKAS